MSLNLPAVFLFVFIIFCVAVVHFRFMALAWLWGGGGGLLEKLGEGVRPASQNPYPISEICDFLYPISDLTKNWILYFRPDP